MPYPYEAKEEADKILKEWDNICKELNIEHYLLYGTCLGIVRDGGYIKGDNDIDVGVRCPEDTFLKLIERLSKSGFTTKKADFFNKHFYKKEILLDIHKSSPKSLTSLFDKVTYNGRVYNIPHPIEEYLKCRYGDWRTPKPKNRQNKYGQP